jgi:hypothetical protein
MIGKMTGLESLTRGVEKTSGASRIAELTKDPEQLQKAISDVQTAKNKKDLAGDATELAKFFNTEDVNWDRALAFLEAVKKKREEDIETQKKATTETTNQFKIDTSRFRAEQTFAKKMRDFQDKSFAQEISQKEAIFAIEQNENLSESEKQKQINATNAAYEMQLAILKDTEQQQNNLNKAISESLSGLLGFDQSQIAEKTSKLADAFRNLDPTSMDFVDQIKTGLKKAGLEGSQGLAEKLIPLLQAALAENENISREQAKQIISRTLGLKLENDGINAATTRARIESQITNEIESRQSTQVYQQELLSLDNSARMLSINQEIEKVKSDYTLTEYEAAKKIVELEKEKRALSEEGINLGAAKERLDLEQQTLDKLKEQIRASGDIGLSKTEKDKLIKEGTNVESLVAQVRGYADIDAENILKGYLEQRDLQNKKLQLSLKEQTPTGETADEALIRKKEGGIYEGIESALKAMTDETDMFAYNLGEKIPQMFADNMSQAISQMIEEGKSFGEVLQGAAYNFVKEINSAMIKNLSQKAATSLLGNGKEGSSGLLGSIFGYASGGPITGGSGTKDDVPAMLMGGEYVINKKSVGKYGPKFLEAINNGTLGGYAKGGRVQSGQGGFFTPGTYGLGGIQGTRNLLKFATQGYTSGSRDQIVNQGNYASINLEPESVRLTNLGRSNSPQAEATRAAKEQAFGLYMQEMQAQAEARKQAEAEKDAFKKQLIMLGISAVGSYVGGIASTGFQQGIAGAGKDATTWQKFTAGMSGVGEKFGNVGSGITSLFSGNLQQAGDYFTMAQSNLANAPKATLVDEAVKAASKSLSFNSSGVTSTYNYNGVSNDVPLPAPPEDYNAISPLNSLAYKELQNRQQVFDLVRDQIEQDPRFFGKDPVLIEALAKQQVSKLVENNSINSYLLGRGIAPKATGGSIPSTGGIDTVPAMLSGGEFIMNRSAAQNIGAGNLQALNAGAGSIVTEEKTEELNEKLIAKLDELIEASSAAGNITINVDGSTGKSSQTTDGGASEQKQQLARQIKDVVLKVIQDEKRLGGSLRK